MSDLVLKYPLDLTGTAPENTVLGEPHTLQPGINRSAVPRHGAFYTESLVVRDADTTQILTPNDQYLPIMYHEEASERSGKEVCAGIIVTDGTVSDNIVIDYQVVGGDFQNVTQIILDLIENLNLDEREVIWGDLLGRPNAFPPSHHLHDIGDVFGFEYLVEAIGRLKEAVLYGDIASHDELKAIIQARREELQANIDQLRLEYEEHEARVDNPHAVTKAQTGLGSVANHPLASKLEAESGTLNTRYMTPLRTAEAIYVQATIPLNDHKARRDNPHQVTKAQTGLGLVENYQPATPLEADAGIATNRYMTPATTAQAILTQALIPLDEHEARVDNPHSVTKAQVGLGLVSNYSDSSQLEAEVGTRNDRFMTPLRVSQAITEQAGTLLKQHVDDKSNPHDTTQAQVGLGNVPNWSPVTQVIAEAATSVSHFMNPQRTMDLILANRRLAGSVDGGFVGFYGATKTAGGFYTGTFAPSSVNYRLNYDGELYATEFHGDGRNLTGMVKAQVGLALVDNFPTSTRAEAEVGTRNDRFMTPLRVKEAVTVQAVVPLNAHKALTNNPHSVTKAQVGLGSVQNLPLASVLEAEAGTVNDRYMTPLRVAEAITKQAGSLLAAHVADTTNPHNVTKAQVGLGSVTNLSLASQAEAEVGTTHSRYMTPLRVAQAITSQAGALLQGHIDDKTNPHNVTKAQVGLGSVDNVASSYNSTPHTLARRSSAGDISARLFRSEYDSTNPTVNFIMTQIDTATNNYIRPSTPAQVKASLALVRGDVGLGSVENYPLSTLAEAQAGTSHYRYMTPLRVHQAIAATASADLTTHIADKTNPHNVTKAQVGLSTIPNSITASRGWNTNGSLLTASGMYNHTISGDHDARYYTKGQQDGRYLQLTGGDLTGPLTLSGSMAKPADIAGANSYAMIIRNLGGDGGGLAIRANDNNNDEYALGITNFEGRMVFGVKAMSGDLIGQDGAIPRMRESGGTLQAVIGGVWRQIWPPVWQ